MKLNLRFTTKTLSVNASSESTDVSMSIFFGVIKKGDQGESAYDIWLAQGNSGTPEDFIAWQRQPAVDAAREVANYTASHNTSPTAHTDLRDKITQLETPMYGLQTGVDCSNGLFGGLGTQYPNLCFSGDRTTRAVFTLTSATVNRLQIVLNLGFLVKSISVYIPANSNNVNVAAGGNAAFLKGNIGLNEVIISTNFNTKTSKVFFNGILATTHVSTTLEPPVQIGIGGFDRNTNEKFETGYINSIHIFNYALSDSECTALWNQGDPLNYMLPNSMKGAGANKCVAEFIPCGLLTTKWRDTSNNNDIAAVGTPKLVYEKPQSLNEIIIDTGVFYTDIAAGIASKDIYYPSGYYIDRVIVYSYNLTNLTNVTVANPYDNTNFISGVTMIPNYPISISANASSASGFIASGSRLPISSGSSRCLVTATGNTPTGGMKVKLICKYIGL